MNIGVLAGQRLELDPETTQEILSNQSYTRYFRCDYEKKLIFALRAGVLRLQPFPRIVVMAGSHYFPEENDVVIGVVTARNAQFYTLDIRAHTPAILPVLQFEGATKRNRPDIRVGAAVYARVARLSPHLQPELSCISPFHKKSWSSGEAFFGELKEGLIVQVSNPMNMYLLQPKVAVMDALGSVLKFEITVGMNGRVWIKGDNPRGTLVIANILRKGDEAEELREKVMLEYTAGVIEKLQGK